MSTPILTTKLYIPPPRPKVVLRPRLIERLNEGLHRRLTLIAAPAGFGKTTLLSEWLATYERRAAWLSLDEGDSDPTRFLTYLVAALRMIAPNIGEGVLRVLQSPQPPPTESILTTLLNDITTSPDHFVLVLDDYHVIDAKPVDKVLAFVIEHLPRQVHLVIATREDPQLSLARLRARGQLTELRATDLRFTPDEAAEFLNQVMGLNLSAEEIAALERRTEGWIAGLQMAALSMQGRAEATSFIKSFTGIHHFVLDYLLEEVLQRQPDRIRSFLLQTSILDRLSGPLCDAVTGQEDGRGMLEALERDNLFVVPLDDKRQWYRYHHLFADVLQARSIDEQPNQGPTLHRRASEWYEQNGLRADAIRHALAAEDFERAAGLVELAWPAMRRSRQEATLLGWVKALPDELVRARPVLSVVYAWALLDGGELEAAEARLLSAEGWLDTTADVSERSEALSAEMVVVDEKQFQSLLASIANARAYRAQALGDVPGTVAYTRRALDLLPEGDYYERGTTAALLGLAYWANGNLEAAHRFFADGLASLQMGGGILIMIGGTFSTRAGWLVSAALIVLSFIPFAAGASRLAGLAGGAEITPENARFFAVPLPVVLHILSASLFCILGAFQFAPGFRRRRPGWHRRAGRLLVPCGLVAGLSGLWMTQFYPLRPHLQGDVLYGFRILFGSAMVLSIALGLAAIRRRDIAQHRAWIIRGYAIGQGAGTQALVGLPWFLISGKPSELNNALMMGACWVVNLAVAEWIIRSNSSRGR